MVMVVASALKGDALNALKRLAAGTWNGSSTKLLQLASILHLCLAKVVLPLTVMFALIALLRLAVVPSSTSITSATLALIALQSSVISAASALMVPAVIVVILLLVPPVCARLVPIFSARDALIVTQPHVKLPRPDSSCLELKLLAAVQPSVVSVPLATKMVAKLALIVTRLSMAIARNAPMCLVKIVIAATLISA